ncbi:hypothetical protein LCGC14_2586520, partial [marine sediment metagenome]
PPALDEVGVDPVKVRLDFGNQVTVMYTFEDMVATVKVVSALDVAHSLSDELSFSSQIFPRKDILWWTNTRRGPIVAIWEEPKVRKFALQERAMGEPRRFTIPMPGLIFLTQGGQPPWVYATKRRPIKPADLVYQAPLCNLFADGRSCPGSHKYPMAIGQIPDSFFRSFFSATAELGNRSQKFPQNVVHLWEFLAGKKTYPMSDLVKHGTVRDLMQMEVGR